MPIDQLLATLGKNINLELSDVIALVEGNPVSIPVQPFTTPVAGKVLTVSLQGNAVQLQLK